MASSKQAGRAFGGGRRKKRAWRVEFTLIDKPETGLDEQFLERRDVLAYVAYFQRELDPGVTMGKVKVVEVAK